MDRTRAQNDLLNVGPFLRVDLQHAVNERLQTLGITRGRMFVLRVEHSHGY